MKKGLTFNSMLLFFALVPLVTCAVILTIVTGVVVCDNVEENTKEELKLASNTLREYYEYDLINDIDLVDGFCQYDTQYIDKIGNNGVDFTLFNKDVRFMTTIRDNNGKRIEGTKASEAVWKEVSAGNDYYSDDVVINGIDYYVYYSPLTDGTTVYGMAFAGKTADHVKAAMKQTIGLTIGISMTLMVIFSLISILLAKKIAGPLQDTAENIKKAICYKH